MNGRLAQYRYDRSSNRQWRRDAAAHAAGVVTEDQWYEYDGLYQVAEFQRGTLSRSYPNFLDITPLARNQDWNYDAMGHWLGFQNDAVHQTRQFNKVNEQRHLRRGAETAASQTRPQGGGGRLRRRRQITSINGPSGVVTPLYDLVGNMTIMPAVSNWTTAQTLTWDAWNRLVKVSEGSITIAEYSYDALFRRVTKTVSGTTRRFYYSDQWQIFEEYLGSAVNPEMRYWYGLRDINDIARRQRYSSGTTLQDDLYALRETMNVVALVNTSGTVTQRMAYDAFGNVRFLTAVWSSSNNAANWLLLFHAHLRDDETGLYQIRFRYYQPHLGVWLSRDPIEMELGSVFYTAFVNSPYFFNDLDGRAPTPNDAAAPSPPALSNAPKTGSHPATTHLPDVPQDKIDNYNKYNCAGLAFRTYTEMSEQVALARLQKCSKMQRPEDKEPEGTVKCCYYSLELEQIWYDRSGPELSRNPIPDDWHVACGNDKVLQKYSSTGRVMNIPFDRIRKGSQFACRLLLLRISIKSVKSKQCYSCPLSVFGP